MLFHYELFQKRESFILQNKTMRNNLDKHIEKNFQKKEPALLTTATKTAPLPQQLTKSLKHKSEFDLNEVSLEIKKVKLTKGSATINLVPSKKNVLIYDKKT